MATDALGVKSTRLFFLHEGGFFFCISLTGEDNLRLLDTQRPHRCKWREGREGDGEGDKVPFESEATTLHQHTGTSCKYCSLVSKICCGEREASFFVY